MKLSLATFLFVGLLAHAACGQGAQADQIKRRAKETVNQNNVRQGVPAPAQTQPRPPATAAPPATNNAVTQAQSLTRIKSDLAGFKTGTVATAEQKQKLTVNLAYAARGPKPSLATVKKFVDSLTAALTGATLAPEQQARLAQNLEAACNAKSFPATQFDKIIEDTQAILEVGTVKRTTALSVAADLKAIGAEVRR
jgi:hypothetical protein